jgi:hypothetical protein
MEPSREESRTRAAHSRTLAREHQLARNPQMPKTLHLIQAGVKNRDKAWLERAARQHLRSSPNWVVPKGRSDR